LLGDDVVWPEGCDPDDETLQALVSVKEPSGATSIQSYSTQYEALVEHSNAISGQCRSLAWG